MQALAAWQLVGGDPARGSGKLVQVDHGRARPLCLVQQPPRVERLVVLAGAGSRESLWQAAGQRARRWHAVRLPAANGRAACRPEAGALPQPHQRHDRHREADRA